MNRKGLVLLLSLIFGLNALWAADTKLSMELWNRYTFERMAGDTEKSAFSLERGYFRLEPTFTDKIKGRFNLDFFASDKYSDGAGMKLKYAYVQFSDIIPIPESNLSAGLDKIYFGTVYDWEYVTIEKALEDKEKVTASADYGLFFSGLIPNGFGEYAISLINGEGYSKAGSKVNINPSPVVNLRLIPLTGVTLGGSILYEKAGFLDTVKTEYDKRMVYAGVARFAFGPLDAWFEYLAQDYAGKKSNGFMVMTVLRFVKPLDIVFRFDNWDPNTDNDNDAYRTLIGGFNWNILHDSNGVPSLFVQTNWQRKMYEDSEKDPVDALMVQLRWKFSNSL